MIIQTNPATKEKRIGHIEIISSFMKKAVSSPSVVLLAFLFKKQSKENTSAVLDITCYCA